LERLQQKAWPEGRCPNRKKSILESILFYPKALTPKRIRALLKVDVKLGYSI